MKASEVKVGGLYLAKVGGAVTTVRLDSITEGYDGKARYNVTNLKTGRKTMFRSAAKFRCGVKMDPTGRTHVRNSEGNFRPVGNPDPKPGLRVGERESIVLAQSFSKNGTVIEGDSIPDTSPKNPPEIVPPEEGAIPPISSEGTILVETSGPTGDSGEPFPESREESSDPSLPSCLVLSPEEVEGQQRPDPTPTSAQSVEDGRGTASASAHDSLPNGKNHPRPFVHSDNTPPILSPDAVGVRDARPSAPLGIASLLSATVHSEGLSSDRKVVGGHKPTDEQDDIIECADQAQREKAQCIVISAGAGAGKTATLKMLESVLKGRGQYTAFNSSLVADAKSKFRKCRVNTTHSLAFGITGRQFAHRLNGPRMRSEEVARILGIAAMEVPSLDDPMKDKKLSAGFLAGQCTVAVRKFCQSADREVTERHFKYIDGIDQPSNGKRGHENNNHVKRYLLPFARKMWEDMSDPKGTLPFNHDCYVKTWGLGEGAQAPYIPADYILLDEAQDTAPVLLDILRSQTHALLIFVGDSNQQIYDWRGAVDAMKSFPDAPRRLLTLSFRFGQTIADVANSVLATLEEPTDLRMRGLLSIPSRVAPVDEPRCTLCRTNARAVATVLQAFTAGKKPHLIGGGADTIAFVRGARDLKSGRGTSHPELSCFSSWTEVEIYSKTDEGEDLKLMVRIIKEFGCDAILAALENMPEEKYADLVVSTAHKSKGREWQSVKLAEDFPPATRMTDSDRRLLYVALTRAKLELDISVCPPFMNHVDENTGEESPGIQIQYTVPMPEKVEGPSPLTGVTRIMDEGKLIDYSRQDALLKSSPPPTDDAKREVLSKLQFTWTNHDGAWLVKGPPNWEREEVEVTRKNGTKSREALGEAAQKYPDFWLYRVARR